GEFRRVRFSESFSDVAGFEEYRSGWASAAHLLEPRAKRPRRGTSPHSVWRAAATARLRLACNRPLAEYQFVRALTTRPAKVTLIGPERILASYDAERSRPVYADADAFLADVVAIERQMIDWLAQGRFPLGVFLFYTEVSLAAEQGLPVGLVPNEQFKEG